MNIGKLVREKMKLHRTDCSGEYVDNTGKHFTMSGAADGYTVSYGGDNKREVSISKEQGVKLAGACRKLELAEPSEKRLAASDPADEVYSEQKYKGQTLTVVKESAAKFIAEINGTKHGFTYNNGAAAEKAGKEFIDRGAK